jgi:hypothetical protein
VLLTALHGSLRVSRTEVAGAQRKGVSFSQVLGFECVPSRSCHGSCCRGARNVCEKTLFLTNSHTIHTSLTASTSCLQPVAPGPAPCVQRTVRHIMGGGHRCCAPCCALVPATATADDCTAAVPPEAIVRRISSLIVLYTLSVAGLHSWFQWLTVTLLKRSVVSLMQYQ